MAHEAYRWQTDQDTDACWQAQHPEHDQVNASCLVRYEADQEETPTLMGYYLSSYNAAFPGEMITAEEVTFVDPPEDWESPHRT